MLKRGSLIAALATVLGVLGPAGIARAANTYTVNTTADSNDGACTPAQCSLRDAVVAADASGGPSTITLPAGTYTLMIASSGADEPQNGDLDIDNDASVTIAGAGSGSTTINANKIDRAFAVQSGAALSLSGMTIENGVPSGNSTGNLDGGAVWDAGTLGLTGDVTLTANQASAGGAIFIQGLASGALTVTGSTLSDNSADLEGGAIFDQGSASETLDGDRFLGNSSQQAGGGVFLESNTPGTDTVNGDEFDNNTAGAQGGGGGPGGGLVFDAGGPLDSTGSSFIDNSADGGAFGGGIVFAGSAPVSLVNATVSGNTALTGAGIDFLGSNPTTMTNDTITFNDATSSGGGGGVGDPSSATTGSGSTGVRNTIIAQNTGGDCSNGGGGSQFSSTVDAGHNLDSDSSCFNQPTDKPGVANPLVAHPADNGGPVLTDALESGSPAIDAGTDVDCPATDARGVTRPQGASCDIGAYEAASPSLAAANSAPATATTGVPFDDTITVSNTSAAPSLGTTVSDQLPANSTLYGSVSSQGSCSSAGSPAAVTCRLGTLGVGSSATVTLVVAYSQPGGVTDTASATNEEGASASAAATTNVQAPVAPAGATAPTASTGAATGIGQSAATLTGQLTTGGQSTAYFFEYGTSGSYGSITPIVMSAASPQNVSATVSGLKARTKYHYRLVAINDSGSSFGGDQTLTTSRARLMLDSGKLAVKKGRAQVPFTCASATACSGSFSITARVNASRTLRCTVPGKATYRVAAGKRKLVKASLSKPCLAALASHHDKLAARLTARPKSGQAGVVNQPVTLR